MASCLYPARDAVERETREEAGDASLVYRCLAVIVPGCLPVACLPAAEADHRHGRTAGVR